MIKEKGQTGIIITRSDNSLTFCSSERRRSYQEVVRRGRFNRMTISPFSLAEAVSSLVELVVTEGTNTPWPLLLAPDPRLPSFIACFLPSHPHNYGEQLSISCLDELIVLQLYNHASRLFLIQISLGTQYFWPWARLRLRLVNDYHTILSN